MEQGYPEMLTSQEVADMFGVSRSAVLRWAGMGSIKSICPGGGKRLYYSNQPVIAERRLQIQREETAQGEEVNGSARIDQDSAETS